MGTTLTRIRLGISRSPYGIEYPWMASTICSSPVLFGDRGNVTIGMKFGTLSTEISESYRPNARAVLYKGDRLDLLESIPPESADLVVTSPPYNIGKRYERRISLADYMAGQRETVKGCVRILSPRGSICWQVGNHIADDGEVVPLDIALYDVFKRYGLKLRNRIVWHFDHGLHCTKRFSGRHETILWFTKSDDYIFNLDEVRVPQKYPGKKHYKGPRAGQYSSNPLGKNPSDVWVIPNVKHNHVEKTVHPCQFPVELVERLVRALTVPGSLVVDPYMGVGSTVCAAVLRERRGAGADLVSEYVKIARDRVIQALRGTLRVRPMDRPVYRPDPSSKLTRRPVLYEVPSQPRLPSVNEKHRHAR